MSDNIPIEVLSARMTEEGVEITGKFPEGFKLPKKSYSISDISIYTPAGSVEPEPFVFQETGCGQKLLYCTNCLIRMHLGEIAEPQQAVTIINGLAACEDHYEAEFKNIKQGEN